MSRPIISKPIVATCEVDLDGLRGDEGDALADVEALFQQVVVRHDLVDEADSQGFLGVDVVAGEGVAEGVLVSGQQHPDEVGVGDVAHLRLAKDGVLRRDGDVGGEGEPRCRAERPAVDGADDGLGVLPSPHLVADTVAISRAPRVQELSDGLPLAEAVGPDDGGLVSRRDCHACLRRRRMPGPRR